MYISKIRVTGGFLDGINIDLDKGLNVIIGSRGAGKTTLLEIIRHAVGGTHSESEESSKKRSDYIKHALGSGHINLELKSVDSDEIVEKLTVDASGKGQKLELSDLIMVLGQNQLEGIASDAASRLDLLDKRVGKREGFNETQKVNEKKISDLTGEVFNIREKLAELSEKSNTRSELETQQQALKNDLDDRSAGISRSSPF